MEKFVAFNLYGRNAYGAAVTRVIPDGEEKEVYLASEVDTRDAELFMTLRKNRQRIDELERALKSCATTLILDIREREKFLHAAKEAVLEANKALASNTTG